MMEKLIKIIVTPIAFLLVVWAIVWGVAVACLVGIFFLIIYALDAILPDLTKYSNHNIRKRKFPA